MDPEATSKTQHSWILYLAPFTTFLTYPGLVDLDLWR